MKAPPSIEYSPPLIDTAAAAVMPVIRMSSETTSPERAVPDFSGIEKAFGAVSAADAGDPDPLLPPPPPPPHAPNAITHAHRHASRQVRRPFKNSIALPIDPSFLFGSKPVHPLTRAQRITFSEMSTRSFDRTLDERHQFRAVLSCSSDTQGNCRTCLQTKR